MKMKDKLYRKKGGMQANEKTSCYRMLSVDNWLCAGALYRAAVVVSDDERAAVSRACRHLALRLPGRQPLCALLLVGVAYGYFQWTDQRNVSAAAARAAADEPGRQRGHAARPIRPALSPSMATGPASRGSGVHPLPGRDAFPLGGESVQVSLRLLQQEQQAVASGWRRGDALTLTGMLRSPSPARNFGGFDYRRYLRLHHTHWLLSAKGVDQAQVRACGCALKRRPAAALERRAARRPSRRMDLIFPAPQAGFMKSMLIGLTDDLDPERFQQFSELGLTHILAISGLNIAVFLGVCIWVMRRLKLAKETYLLICIWLLPFYILLTGASPSIVQGWTYVYDCSLCSKARVLEGCFAYYGDCRLDHADLGSILLAGCQLSAFISGHTWPHCWGTKSQ